MSIATEFGSKGGADSAREEWADWVCPLDDDKRTKTVHWVSDIPDELLEQIETSATEDRAAREVSIGQAELTDAERKRIDFSAPRANVPWAKSIKGLAEHHGVSDWTAHLDSTLTVDEHRQVMREAGQQGGGGPNEADQRDVERAVRAAGREQAEGCDHARDHCENGDQEACEFLSMGCGYDEREIEAILNPPSEEGAEGPLEGPALAALDRAWNGYKGAVTDLEAALEEAHTNWHHAQQAAKAINAIGEQHEQEELHFERLEDLQGALADLSREAAADCYECHATVDGERVRAADALEGDDSSGHVEFMERLS